MARVVKGHRVDVWLPLSEEFTTEDAVPTFECLNPPVVHPATGVLELVEISGRRIGFAPGAWRSYECSVVLEDAEGDPACP